MSNQIDTLKNDRSTVAPVDLPEPVKKSGRTSSPLFIIAETALKNDRRGEVLAKVYRYILGAEWGQP